MRTILAISLATFVLAVPVAQETLDNRACCLTQYALLQAWWSTIVSDDIADAMKTDSNRVANLASGNGDTPAALDPVGAVPASYGLLYDTGFCAY